MHAELFLLTLEHTHKDVRRHSILVFIPDSIHPSDAAMSFKTLALWLQSSARMQLHIPASLNLQYLSFTAAAWPRGGEGGDGTEQTFDLEAPFVTSQRSNFNQGLLRPLGNLTDELETRPSPSLRKNPSATRGKSRSEIPVTPFFFFLSLLFLIDVIRCRCSYCSVTCHRREILLN